MWRDDVYQPRKTATLIVSKRSTCVRGSRTTYWIPSSPKDGLWLTLGNFVHDALNDVLLNNNITYAVPNYLNNGSAWAMVLPNFSLQFLDTAYEEFCGKLATAIINEIA